jgi:hypothetical protein
MPETNHNNTEVNRNTPPTLLLQTERKHTLLKMAIPKVHHKQHITLRVLASTSWDNKASTTHPRNNNSNPTINMVLVNSLAQRSRFIEYPSAVPHLKECSPEI